jgi:hypothetical protein
VTEGHQAFLQSKRLCSDGGVVAVTIPVDLPVGWTWRSAVSSVVETERSEFGAQSLCDWLIAVSVESGRVAEQQSRTDASEVVDCNVDTIRRFDPHDDIIAG